MLSKFVAQDDFGRRLARFAYVTSSENLPEGHRTRWILVPFDEAEDLAAGLGAVIEAARRSGIASFSR